MCLIVANKIYLLHWPYMPYLINGTSIIKIFSCLLESETLATIIYKLINM